MFNVPLIKEAFCHLIGWKQHYDNTIVVDSDMLQTQTGIYYNESHPILDLSVIKALLPTKRTSNTELNKYLKELVEDSAVQMLNELIVHRQLNKYGKTLLENAVLLNKPGFSKSLITNESKFVGFEVKTKDLTGLSAIIREIGVQMDGTQEFTLYVFHTSQVEPIAEIEVNYEKSNSVEWINAQIELSGIKTKNYYGGSFVIGYYQDDIQVSAINLETFDWNKGTCGGCNDPHHSTWQSIKRNFTVRPLYVPSGNYTKGEMFDLEYANYVNNKSWGLNLRFTVVCDLTSFFIENKTFFAELLLLKVTTRVMQELKFSRETNSGIERLVPFAIRELEGDKETHLASMPKQYERAMKAVAFNISGLNPKCLPCESINQDVSYGFV